MTENEIIHIMSAGANIHNTFPVAITEISPATKIYVIVEDNVYEDVTDEKRQKMLVDIRDSIKTLKEIAKRFVKNGVQEIRTPDDSLERTRDAVIKIYSENQGARFFVNLSGGTKMLSIGLFMIGLWIDAIPYLVDLKSQPRKLSVPKIHIKDLTENPNRVLILKKLDETKSKWMTRKDLFDKVAKEYIPIRERERKKMTLKPGTFSSLISSLFEWELISEEFKEGSKKEKVYRITPDGEFTLNFINLKNIG